MGFAEGELELDDVYLRPLHGFEHSHIASSDG